jgi:hypothetical protein
MRTDNFNSNFVWFTGVVEDINDPSELGRVKVRCYGYHSDNLKEIATSQLPWATPMTPITSAGTSGIGHSATGLLQGSWVVGFFRDGTAAQDPVIMGSIPSKSILPADPTKGFNDPTGQYPIGSYVEEGEQDLPKPSRLEYLTSQPYIEKDDTRVDQVETAIPPKTTTMIPDNPDKKYYERKTWSSHALDDIIKPSYPKNHTHQSESGHIIEIDDTPNAERLSRFHTSGTYEEIVANGDRIVTVVNDEYEVTFKNKNMYVKGNVNLTVDGDMKTLVKKNYHLEVLGNMTEKITGDRSVHVGKNHITQVDQSVMLNVKENVNSLISGNERRTVVKNFDGEILGNSDTFIKGNCSHKTNGTDKYNVLKDQTIAGQGALTVTRSGKIIIDTPSNIDIHSDAIVDIDGPTAINLN